MMVTLFWSAQDFGARFSRAGYPEIRAQYNSLAEAQAQAAHDLAHGKHPVRIEDETGQVLWSAPEGKD